MVLQLSTDKKSKNMSQTLGTTEHCSVHKPAAQ